MLNGGMMDGLHEVGLAMMEAMTLQSILIRNIRLVGKTPSRDFYLKHSFQLHWMYKTNVSYQPQNITFISHQLHRMRIAICSYL